ncbi:hypothetical protein GGR54DRAFT_289386 [Hypoxylon sp. NC1633]|nr:hypothetical protein GGR54DRAFT_289386 [Hypoxylon sp. NC1633]
MYRLCAQHDTPSRPCLYKVVGIIEYSVSPPLTSTSRVLYWLESQSMYVLYMYKALLDAAIHGQSPASSIIGPCQLWDSIASRLRAFLRLDGRQTPRKNSPHGSGCYCYLEASQGPQQHTMYLSPYLHSFLYYPQTDRWRLGRGVAKSLRPIPCHLEKGYPLSFARNIFTQLIIPFDSTTGFFSSPNQDTTAFLTLTLRNCLSLLFVRDPCSASLLRKQVPAAVP